MSSALKIGVIIAYVAIITVIALWCGRGIVSAVLTTANSSLLSASICVTNDIYAGMIRKNASEKEKLLVSKLTIAVFVVLGLLLTTQFSTIISMMFVTYTINALIAIPLFGGMCLKKPGAAAANMALIMGIVSVIVWLLLGTPGDIHVAVIGLPMAALGYALGTIFGKGPTEEQLEAIQGSSIVV